MKQAVVLCILGLAVSALASTVKVTGYSSSSSSILSPTGKIFISTVLTPEAVIPETPVAPVIEEHENSIMPVVEPVFVLPNRTSHRPSPQEPAPVPVVQPSITPIKPAPIAVLPWIETEKPQGSSVFPVIQPGNKLPVVQQPQPVVYPIDRPEMTILPVIQPGNKLPVVQQPQPIVYPIEQTQGPSVFPVVQPGNKLPVVQQPQPVIRPIAPQPSITPIAPAPIAVLPWIEAEKPSVGVYPINRPGLPDEEPEAAIQPIVGKPIVFPVVRPENKLPIVAPQPQITPIAPQPSIMPIAVPEVRPIAPQPVVSPLLPSVMPAVEGSQIGGWDGALIR